MVRKYRYEKVTEYIDLENDYRGLVISSCMSLLGVGVLGLLIEDRYYVVVASIILFFMILFGSMIFPDKKVYFRRID